MEKEIINIWSVKTGSNIKRCSLAMFVCQDSSPLYKHSVGVAINLQSDARFARWLARKFHLPGTLGTFQSIRETSISWGQAVQLSAFGRSRLTFRNTLASFSEWRVAIVIVNDKRQHGVKMIYLSVELGIVGRYYSLGHRESHTTVIGPHFQDFCSIPGRSFILALYCARLLMVLSQYWRNP